jgi:hypothetical protein
MKTIMRLKVIACEVFTREVCYCVAQSPHVIDLEFTPKDAHDKPEVLRSLIQERIDAAHASDTAYDAIALGLGICGNATVGLTSPGTPLILPRAHDCCTILLGSKACFKEHFGDSPSTPFSSAGYIEHGGDLMHEASAYVPGLGLDQSYEDFVEQYGEDNAKYLWETLHPEALPGAHDRVVFIEMPNIDDAARARACQDQAEANGKTFVKLSGSMDMIRKLVFGEWDDETFLTVREGESISGVYDWDKVVKAVSGETD